MKRRIANKIAKRYNSGKPIRYNQRQIEGARKNCSAKFLPFFPRVPKTLWAKYIDLAFKCLNSQDPKTKFLLGVAQ